MDELKAMEIDYEINGSSEHCMPNTINICFNGVSSEALMLSTKQYCGISNGSACNSKSYKPSYVLTAMGLTTERIENSVRISWGANSDLNEVRQAFYQLLSTVKTIKI